MPLYQFKDEATGEVLESYFEFDDAPSIGEHIELCGRRVRRLPSSTTRPTVRNWNIVGMSLPPWAPGAEGYTDARHPAGPGVPLFSSEAAVQKFETESARRAEKNPAAERVKFDRDWGGQWQDAISKKRGSGIPGEG